MLAGRLGLMCAIASFSNHFTNGGCLSHWTMVVKARNLTYVCHWDDCGRLEPVGELRMESWDVKDVCEYLCQLIHTSRDTIWTSCFISSATVTIDTCSTETGGSGGIPPLPFCSKQAECIELIGMEPIVASDTARLCFVARNSTQQSTHVRVIAVHLQLLPEFPLAILNCSEGRGWISCIAQDHVTWMLQSWTSHGSRPPIHPWFSVHYVLLLCINSV